MNESVQALQRARALWRDVCARRTVGLEPLRELNANFLRLGHVDAACWIALAAARCCLYEGKMELAEELLRQASGGFHFLDDKYGTGLVDVHIGILWCKRGEHDRGQKFLAAPINIASSFEPVDRAVLHSAAAQCHWIQKEYHLAVAHLLQELAVVQAAQMLERESAIVGNLGLLLLQLNELELSLLASSKAWELQKLAHDSCNVQLAALSNKALAELYLGRTSAASRSAEQLWCHMQALDESNKLLPLYFAVIEISGATRDSERANAAMMRVEDYAGREFCDSKEGVEARLARASCHEANAQYVAAIDLVKSTLGSAERHLNDAAKIGAALICARCYRGLSNEEQSRHWLKVASQRHGQGFVDTLLVTQLKQKLKHLGGPINLSPIELKCLQLAAAGQTSADIGLKLGIKPRTVNFHFGNILRKLSAANRQEAIAKAFALNLLRPSR